MTRFIAVCVLGAGACVLAMVFLGQAVWSSPQTKPSPGPYRPGQGKPRPPEDGPPSGGPETPKAPTTSVDDERPVVITELAAVGGGPRALVIQDARVLPSERQDVPSEREGKLLFIATEAGPAEKVPPEKLVEYEVALLAKTIDKAEWEKTPDIDRLPDMHNTGKHFRRARPDDELAPGETSIIRQTLRFRKLDVGDRVKKGQLLGVINPALALEDLAVKQSKLESAAADVLASAALKEESARRLNAINSLRARYKGAVTDDDWGVAKVTLERYRQEEVSKRAAVTQSQRELSAAQTTLGMHMIRASIDGVIKNLYKQNGEAVKPIDPTVLQIQNPDRLRVEAQLELQDALPLRDRLQKARNLRAKASGLRSLAYFRRQGVPPEAERLEAEADQLAAVQIEASRVTPPLAALAGHLQEVTCVAVTRDRDPLIVSGSEDGTVRIWKRSPASERWQEHARLDHRAIVRAVACAGAKAKSNMLLTATATGRARLFDLDNLKSSERFLKGRHSGAINAAAFNADGTRCVTGGEDRAICLWDTADGSLLGKVAGAHGSGVTSLTFTAKNQVVSAGRDKRLVVWNLAEGGEGGQTLEKDLTFERRSGDVAQLGVDPSGDHTLFDDGRELRVLSLSTKKIEGTIQNASSTAAFATLALYSPDGNTILTNGNTVGRLQLWRAPTSKTRPAELRQYAWSSGNVTAAAFAPDGKFVVTGTQDNRVVVWQMPERAEAEKPIDGQLTYVEEFLDTSLKRVTVRAIMNNPGGMIIPGSSATIVVPPLVSFGR